MVRAIVLAAGESSRMGSPKAALRAPDGRPFIVRIVSAFRDAGVGHVTVVTGPHHDATVAAMTGDLISPPAVFARNPDPTRGQLSSLWVGMDAAVDGDTEALLVTLVDIPMIDARTIAAVVAAWRRAGAPIVRPAIGERHGHPVLFDRALFAELRAAPLDQGAKHVVRKYETQILNLPVPDEGSLIDVDTPGDFDALSRRGI